jgi:ABC-type glycerol-3-phosphate transport system permease component
LSAWKSSTRRIISKRLFHHSYRTFFTISIGSFLAGSMLSIFDTVMIYWIGLIVGSTVMGTAFVLFIIPVIISMLKKYPDPLPIGLELAAGADGQRVRLNLDNKPKIIDFKF